MKCWFLLPSDRSHNLFDDLRLSIVLIPPLDGRTLMHVSILAPQKCPSPYGYWRYSVAFFIEKRPKKRHRKMKRPM